MTRTILLGLTGLEIDGGIASVNRCILRALEHAVAAGDLDRVDRVVLERGGEHAVEPPRAGVERHAGGSQGRFVLELWRRALRRPDLVFFDHFGLAQAGRLPLPGLRGRRQVVFVHGGELLRIAGGGSSATLQAAWRILVNSEHTAAWVREVDPSLAEKTRVVPLCIDPERIAAWSAWDAEAPPPSTRKPAALIVGRMLAEERGKGHDDLIAAWPTVRRAVPDAELWIAGGGDDQPRLEREVRERGLESCVTFLGRVSEKALHERMHEASALAMPSKQEGFGLVYAEAAWHGTPSIGSSRDSARFVIRDGETGVVVPYGDRDAIAASLVRLLGDADLRRRMGEAGRADVEERFLFPRFQRDLMAALELPAP